MAALANSASRPSVNAPIWATAGRVFEHRARQYRRLYRASLFGSFGIPALFLTAMGFGLGGYVDRTPDAVLAGVSYLQFLAPGLLASSLMQTGVVRGDVPDPRRPPMEPDLPCDGRDAPRRARRRARNIAWIAVRLALVGTIFAFVIVLFGASRSWLIVFAVPVAVLTGLAFATPIMAFTATQRTPDRFAQIFRFGVTPLFLFSGTFYPIESLPSIIQPIAWLSPLWHGVAVTRALMLGTVGDAPALMLVHVVILLAIAIGGGLLAIRTIHARLEKG